MLRTFSVAELVEKKVVPLGNGSVVYTPKKWIGKTVSVILEEKPVDVVSEVLTELKPHISAVEGIFLFGSFARSEQKKDSDIDVLVISEKPLDLKKRGQFDFLVKKKSLLVEELKKDGTLFLRQLLSEAKPIFNSSLLGELQKTKTEPDFNRFFQDTLTAFSHVQQLLEKEKKQGKTITGSGASIFSLILRLKTLFLIHCFAKKIPFSNTRFDAFLKSHGFSEETIRAFLTVFRAERQNQATTEKIALQDAEKLFETAKIAFLDAEKAVKK